MISASRLASRGVSRSSRHVRRGCGGRRRAVRRAARRRTAKSCGPDAPRLRRQVGDDAKPHRADNGGKQDGSPGRARISRQTIAQGRPVVTACTCGHAPFAHIFWREGPGCSGHPAFPAPSDFRRGRDDWQSSGETRREAKDACPFAPDCISGLPPGAKNAALLSF